MLSSSAWAAVDPKRLAELNTDLMSEEPLSLRRLRESLSSLEQLDRQRAELRERCDGCPLGLIPSFGEREAGPSPVGSLAYSGLGGCADAGRVGRCPCEGLERTGSSRRSPSPPTYGLHASLGGSYGDSGGLLQAEGSRRGSCSCEEGRRGFSGLLPREGWQQEPLASSRSLQEPVATGPPCRCRGREDAAPAVRLGSPEGAIPWPTQISSSMAAQHYKLREALDEARQSAGELERERDEALRRAADQDAEVERQREQAHKMARMLERTEADHRSLQIELRQLQEENRTLKAEYEQIQDEQHRERTELQRERSELQRLRREHRDTLEQVAALKSEAHQSHMRAEELRGRLEVTISDQLQQISDLEGTGKKTSQELDVQSSRAAGLGDALYTSLHERTALLHFLIDVLTTIRSLLDPPPATSGSSRPSSPRTPRRGAGRRGTTPRAGSRGLLTRERSNSCERIHKHSGCYVCGGHGEQRSEEWKASLRDSYGAVRQASNVGLAVSAEDVPALLEFIDSLERELGDASQEYGSLVQRLLSEAERTARVLRGELAPGHMPPSEKDVQRACLDWIEQERMRRERLQLPLEGPALCVDWSEERDRYQATTRSMEAKFAKLARLKRMLQVRQTPAPRKTRG